MNTGPKTNPSGEVTFSAAPVATDPAARTEPIHLENNVLFVQFETPPRSSMA